MKCLKIENFENGEIKYLVSLNELKDAISCSYNYASMCNRKLENNKFVKAKGWLLSKVDVDVVERN